MKTCSKCKVEKPESEFHKKANHKDGLSNICKSCCAEYHRHRYPQIRDHVRELGRAYYQSNKPERKRCVLNARLKRTYGVTLEQRKQMYISQGGACAICRERFLQKEKICLDHDHKTGGIRALLCRECNTGLGGFRDNGAFLSSAIDYLNKYQGQKMKGVS